MVTSALFNKEEIKNRRNNTPFFVFSEKTLIDSVREYKHYLPKETEICYAMKANSEQKVLEILNKEKASFEVASKYELSLLKELRVPAHRIIYGTSIKPSEHIREFVKYGVDRFAFDSEQELLKIAKYAPGSKVYLRVLVDDRSESVFTMSEKFGAPIETANALFLSAQKAGLKPYGISFNVGSQAKNEHAWARGVNEIAAAMRSLLKDGIKISVINFGGGFPYNHHPEDDFPKLEHIAKHINKALKKIPYRVTYIAEPGRVLVANSFALVTKVIAKNKRENGDWLYVDGGVYNALLEAMTCQGSTKYHTELLSIKKNSASKKTFILTGPTGDNLDIISKKVSLPANIDIGDKLIIYNVGAYTFTLMTRFNGFPKPRTIEV